MFNIIDERNKIQRKDVLLGKYENQFSAEMGILLLLCKYFVYHCISRDCVYSIAIYCM